MSVTREKMAAQLRRAIQAVLDRGLHDPRITGLVSVTRIELSPDCLNATVFVTVLPESRAELSLHGVVSATAHIRSQVSRRADFRRVPTLHFRRDVVRRREADVLTAIARATADDEARAAQRAVPGRFDSIPQAGEAPGTAGGPGAEGAAAAAGAKGGTSGDEDVLAAFDEFVDAAAKDGPRGEPGAEAVSDHDRSGGPDDLTSGDRHQRRPEDDAT